MTHFSQKFLQEFHQVRLISEAIRWILASSVLLFSRIPGEAPVAFQKTSSRIVRETQIRHDLWISSRQIRSCILSYSHQRIHLRSGRFFLVLHSRPSLRGIVYIVIRHLPTVARTSPTAFSRNPTRRAAWRVQCLYGDTRHQSACVPKV